MRVILYCIALFGSSLLAVAGDFDLQISAQKKTHQGEKSTAGPGGISKAKETCAFEITVNNNSSKDTPQLEARYIVFVLREQLGEKKGVDPTERVKGSKPIEPIKAHNKAVIQTDDIALKQSSLTGGWHYDAGGKINAKDATKGIWIKIFQGDTVVGEYALPSTIKDKENWDK